MSTTTAEPRWTEYHEIETDRPVRVAHRSGGRRFDLVHLPAHEGQREATYRVRYRTVGQNFGTVGAIETAGGARLIETETRGLGAYDSCRRDAVRWILTR